MTEQWKPVPNYEGFYDVSDCGSIRSVERKVPHTRSGFLRIKSRIIKDASAGAGYRNVQLYGKSGRKAFYVHELVLFAFIGPRPESKRHCRHIDGNKHNNRLTNLAWGSPKENFNDMHAHGTLRLGSSRWSSKLNEEQVLMVRSSPKNNCELAETLGISNQQVSRIKTGKQWKHVPL